MEQPKWNSNDISDQSGRVALVTGASSGIGYEAARVLAGKNATVIVAVRNLKKGNAASDKIKAEFPDSESRLVEAIFNELKNSK